MKIKLTLFSLSRQTQTEKGAILNTQGNSRAYTTLQSFQKRKGHHGKDTKIKLMQQIIWHLDITFTLFMPNIWPIYILSTIQIRMS